MSGNSPLATTSASVVRPADTQGDVAHRRSKRRILIWATIVALIAGLLEFAQPVDDYARMFRNAIRSAAPSRDIAIIGVDDSSIDSIGAWPWPRKRHAQIVTALDQAGVRRIFFDILFTGPSTEDQDKAFADAIKASGRVHIAASNTYDIRDKSLSPKMPYEPLARNAGLVSIFIRYSGLAAIRQLPYATSIGGRRIPSLAAELAGVSGPAGKNFSVDYGIDLRKIDTYSAKDVINGKVGKNVLQGRDVVIALASRELGDLYFLPGRGVVHGAYIMVAGAETLKGKSVVDLGWFLPLVIGFLLSTLHIFCRIRWIGRIYLVAGVFGVTILPLVAEANHIFYDIMPASLLVGTVAISAAWTNFRQSYKVRGNINQVSGMPNLNALREEKLPAAVTVVAARVRNFAVISSTLPADSERALVEQITARLALGARGARIYQGDEGIFVWTASRDACGPDQLDALHALFRSPALIDGRQVDLAVTFGMDIDEQRGLANRIGATLVAADEAASEGLRWKAYDPAKLADAEWKLSLLGRLDSAIDSGEIWVAYQPQLDLATGRLSGAEALVRWSHPEKGEISPAEFVLAAEQHDRIDRLTEFVLTDAIRTAAAFNAKGIAFEVAVNISARLLEKHGLVDMVRRHLADARLEASLLTLEVTESAAMASGRTSIRTLEEIGSLGINVSIDDYGTGFSTLDYFKRIPATEVKIDRGFVASIDRNASDRLMVRSTIELAHSLGRSVVAEGVETSSILAELTNLGCDKAQGYLIGRPMKVAALTKLMLEHERSRAA